MSISEELSSVFFVPLPAERLHAKNVCAAMAAFSAAASKLSAEEE
jgi:hypothetical protein